MTTPLPEDMAGLAEQLAVAIDQVPAGQRMIKGLFSVWKTDNGLMIVYRLDGQEADERVPIPKAVIRLAVGAASGRGPLGMLSRMLG